MRRYRIEITDTTGAAVQTYDSQVNGLNNPGALDVVFDIFAQQYATPLGGSYVKVWGVPLQTISQASDFNNKSIAVYGGMGKGLPLANPQQFGLIARGSILQSFGNWINTEQSLDLILAPPFGTDQTPANISFNWTRGANLGDALKSALSVAYPKFTVSVNIRSITLPYDAPGAYTTMEQFAYFVKQASKAIVNDPKYQGVSITAKDMQITVFDGSGNTKPKKTAIQFQDLIGQPTWVGLNTIQFKTVMRSDLNVGDECTMPPSTIATTTATSFSQYRDKSAFQGTFIIQQARHNGHFRQPDADSWNTTVDAVTSGQ